MSTFDLLLVSGETHGLPGVVSWKDLAQLFFESRDFLFPELFFLFRRLKQHQGFLQILHGPGQITHDFANLCCKVTEINDFLPVLSLLAS